MKRLLCTVILLATLCSFASCKGAFSPSETSPTTTVSETPPVTTEAPSPAVPESLTEEEQIALLALALEAAGLGLAFDGTVRLTDSDGSEQSFSVSGRYALADEPLASVVFSSDREDGLRGELSLADRELSFQTKTSDGNETVKRLSELAFYGAFLEQSERILSGLSELREFSREYAAELDALLALSGAEFGSGELIALLSLLGRICTEGFSGIGIEPTVSFEDGGAVDDAARALYALCAEYDRETALLTLSPTRVLSLVSHLYGELERRLDQRLSLILDELLGEGQTAELYRRLASFRGSDTLSVWRAEVESILVSEGILTADFYKLIAALLDRSMSAEMTADRLLALLDENAERTLDSLLALFGYGGSYTDLLRDLHSILSMPPTSIYTAFGGIGSLGERLKEAKEGFDRHADCFDLSLVLDLGGNALSAASVTLALELPYACVETGMPSSVGLSLSLALTE